MKRYLTYTLAAGLGAMLLTSCFSDKRKPGWEYMPDMAHSVAYDAYTENPHFKDGQTSRQPVKGTVPLYQGVIGKRNNFTPYPFANTIGGYDSAGALLKNPIALTPQVATEGKRLYDIYCSPCHGLGGRGDGSIVVNPNIKNPFPPPPSYFTPQLLALPEGKMYHSVHHGRNLMGSYASQLDNDQIWMVLHHVRQIQMNYSDSLRGVVGTPVTEPTADASTSSNTTSNNATTTPQSK